MEISAAKRSYFRRAREGTALLVSSTQSLSGSPNSAGNGSGVHVEIHVYGHGLEDGPCFFVPRNRGLHGVDAWRSRLQQFLLRPGRVSSLGDVPDRLTASPGGKESG